jgi:copper(I)-binding protein
MKKFLLLLFIPYLSLATSINVENIQVREPFKPNSPLTIYLDIVNNADQLDYLIGAEIIAPAGPAIPKNGAINKSIIDKAIAKTIQINRLVIPANTKVSLAPLGIYIASYDYQKNSKLKLVFENHEEAIIDIPSK